ncbi:MAG: InlB B-repeat-containing protein [Treponema sp.]|nr:InlB B-repeat-containing protein [Treponema sp.]
MRTKFKYIAIFAILSALLVMSGCQNDFLTLGKPADGDNSLVLRINKGDGRTILPLIGSIAIYELTITDEFDNKIVDEELWDGEDPYVIEELQQGDYNVVLIGFDAEDNPVARGILDFSVPNAITEYEIELKPIKDGDGFFTWDFTGIHASITKIDMTIILLDDDGEEVPESEEVMTLFGTGAITDTELELEAGIYSLVFELSGPSGTVTWRETLHIYKNLTSTFDHAWNAMSIAQIATADAFLTYCTNNSIAGVNGGNVAAVLAKVNAAAASGAVTPAEIKVFVDIILIENALDEITEGVNQNDVEVIVANARANASALGAFDWEVLDEETTVSFTVGGTLVEKFFDFEITSPSNYVVEEGETLVHYLPNLVMSLAGAHGSANGTNNPDGTVDIFTGGVTYFFPEPEGDDEWDLSDYQLVEMTFNITITGAVNKQFISKQANSTVDVLRYPSGNQYPQFSTSTQTYQVVLAELGTGGGFTFQNNGDTGVEANFKLVKAVFKRADVYTVSFSGGEYAEMPPIGSINIITGRSLGNAIPGNIYAMPANPSRDGYDFVNWHLNEELYPSSPYPPITGNIELVAQWTLIEDRTVSFNLDGGTYGGSPEMDDVIVDNGTAMDSQFPAEVPVKPDLVFDGWWDMNSMIEYTDSTIVSSNVTLTARWIQAYVAGGIYQMPLRGIAARNPQEITAQYGGVVIPFDFPDGFDLEDYLSVAVKVRHLNAASELQAAGWGLSWLGFTTQDVTEEAWDTPHATALNSRCYYIIQDFTQRNSGVVVLDDNSPAGTTSVSPNSQTPTAMVIMASGNPPMAYIAVTEITFTPKQQIGPKVAFELANFNGITFTADGDQYFASNYGVQRIDVGGTSWAISEGNLVFTSSSGYKGITIMTGTAGGGNNWYWNSTNGFDAAIGKTYKIEIKASVVDGEGKLSLKPNNSDGQRIHFNLGTTPMDFTGIWTQTTSNLIIDNNDATQGFVIHSIKIIELEPMWGLANFNGITFTADGDQYFAGNYGVQRIDVDGTSWAISEGNLVFTSSANYKGITIMTGTAGGGSNWYWNGTNGFNAVVDKTYRIVIFASVEDETGRLSIKPNNNDGQRISFNLTTTPTYFIGTWTQTTSNLIIDNESATQGFIIHSINIIEIE